MITFAQNEYWHCAQVPLLQTSSGGHQIFAKCHSLADLHISQSKMNIKPSDWLIGKILVPDWSADTINS